MEKEGPDIRFEKFPTREDIKTALENLNQSLDRRFAAIHELVEVKENNLRELIEESRKQTELRITCVQREMTVINDASEKAITKADAANEKRFESVNEFRAQMADQSVLFIPRREVETLFNSNSEKITALTDRMNRSEGRGMGISQLAGWIFGGAGFLVGLIAIFSWLSSMQPKVEENSKFREQVAPVLQTKPQP
jgi:chorismate mutase